MHLSEISTTCMNACLLASIWLSPSRSMNARALGRKGEVSVPRGDVRISTIADTRSIGDSSHPVCTRSDDSSVSAYVSGLRHLPVNIARVRHSIISDEKCMPCSRPSTSAVTMSSV